MRALRFWWRPTIRVRLTMLYGGTFFLAGLMLVILLYAQLGQVLDRQFIARTQVVASSGEVPSALPEGSQAKLTWIGRPDGPAPTGAEGPHSFDQLMVETQRSIDAQLQRARRSTLQRMLIASISLLGVVGALAGVLGWGLAGQALHPLRQITATARRVAGRNLHERIALSGPSDEIKDLADTLDTMFDHLDKAFDSQQRFIANASHELRTPLAINRTLIEVALMDSQSSEKLRQLGATLLAVNQRHERLIDGLLTLTSSEQRILDPVPVDFAEIAAHVAAESQLRATDARLKLETALRPAPTTGEPVLLERLIENLVENAIRYNLPEGGWVTVATSTTGDSVALAVENSGPVIPHYDLPRLFEPFQRLSRTERRADPTGASTTRGAGLGLSIVRTIARAHGGEATAAPREDGGLVVRVVLPAMRCVGEAE
jgi:signal transduction histidine kinase